MNGLRQAGIKRRKPCPCRVLDGGGADRVLDAVFSLDSVITAVGMVKEFHHDDRNDHCDWYHAAGVTPADGFCQ